MIELNSVSCGDCLDIMPQISNNSIDMILCDLPYGTTACKWDVIIPFESLWKQYKRIIKNNGVIVLTASQPFTSYLILSNIEMFKYELIWDKIQGKQPMLAHKRPMKSHENICIFYRCQPVYSPQMRPGKAYKDNRTKGNFSIHRGYTKPCNKKYKGRFPVSVIPYLMYNKIGNHPTQKPVELFEYLIKTYTNESDLVLDNCAGSGTTGVACKNLNRNFILIEKEQKYIDIIYKRLNEN